MKDQSLKNKVNNDGIEIHPLSDFDGMRRAGKLAAEVLDMITDHVRIGVTTEELNTLCHDFIIKHGAIPAPLNYKGFPKSICTSINEVVCHGIPSSDRDLKNGDIINIDVTVILDGWYGDTSRMYIAGDAKIKPKRLIDVTYNAMMAGISAVKPGATLGDISKAIQKVAHDAGYKVERDFCGHGLGTVFHTEPQILHYFDEKLYSLESNPWSLVLEPGMFFTIEPMINTEKGKTKVSKEDGWTATTKGLSAQFEHSLAVTETGVEIFTLSPKGYTKPPYNI